MSTRPFMLCPVDGSPLTMSERQSVEIDYCPQCRGVWLDRGELDKIIERAAAEEARAAPPPAAPVAQPSYAPPPPQPSQPWGHQPHYGHQAPYGYKRKKKSFLEELFD